MVDNNKDNDEYDFSDLDNLGSDPRSGEESFTNDNMPTKEPGAAINKDIIRNSLIAVGVVILAMLIYKFVGSFFSKKTTSQSTVVTTVKQPVEEPKVTVTPVPIQDTALQEARQQLANMGMEQQNIRTDMSNLNNQLATLSTDVANLDNKIAAISQNISTLSATVEQQSQQIAALLVVRSKKPTIVKVIHKPAKPRAILYIQAIIPGRAWLISTKGSTLTVREGTNIAGYGIVKLIDPIQGRVLTSSGRVIRFSQEDS